jgi:hypothetical protein
VCDDDESRQMATETNVDAIAHAVDLAVSEESAAGLE